MSLLFDENLSPHLIRRLEAAYPQSEHVQLVGLNVGNAGAEAIAELLAMRRESVQTFLSDPETSLLVLDLPIPERGMPHAPPS